MTNIIVVFPKIEDARSIRNLLTKSGFTVASVCTTGSQAITNADNLNDGIVVCGYKFPDMMYAELHEYLPSHFDMLLVASRGKWEDCRDNNIVCVEMPIKVHDLINTVSMMCETIERRRKKRKLKPRTRSDEEVQLIRDAKELLMVRNNMSEEEAHRYIQKCSMDSGTNMVETAQMVLSLMKV